MKFFTVLALLNAASALSTGASAKVDAQGLPVVDTNQTLSSEYLLDAQNAIRVVKIKALKDENTNAKRMVKYYQGVADKTDKQLKDMNVTAPTKANLAETESKSKTQTKAKVAPKKNLKPVKAAEIPE